MPARRFCYGLGIVVSIVLTSMPALANTATDAGSNKPVMPSEQGPAPSADNDPADNPSDPASQPLVLSERMHLQASPEKVWATVGDFGSPELWIPGIKETNLLKGQDNQSGARRQITRQDDRTLVEQLLARDGPNKRLTYRMIHGWLPVTHYKSTLAVQPDDDDSGSYVVWEARFQPGGGRTADNARQAVQQYYVTALQNLRSMLSTGGSSETDDTDNKPQ